MHICRMDTFKEHIDASLNTTPQSAHQDVNQQHINTSKTTRTSRRSWLPNADERRILFFWPLNTSEKVVAALPGRRVSRWERTGPQLGSGPHSLLLHNPSCDARANVRSLCLMHNIKQFKGFMRSRQSIFFTEQPASNLWQWTWQQHKLKNT